MNNETPLRRPAYVGAWRRQVRGYRQTPLFEGEMEEAGDPARLRLYVDGACIGNPGPGGWAYVLLGADGPVEASGSLSRTTNQRAELGAAIKGLEASPIGSRLVVISDSQYVVQGMTSWLRMWQRNGWTNSRGEPVANQDLWQWLAQLARAFDVRWQWVRGHVPESAGGDRWNHRADALATAAAAALVRTTPGKEALPCVAAGTSRISRP